MCLGVFGILFLTDLVALDLDPAEISNRRRRTSGRFGHNPVMAAVIAEPSLDHAATAAVRLDDRLYSRRRRHARP